MQGTAGGAGLGAVLPETKGVGHGQGHDFCGRETTQGAFGTFPLGERPSLVRAAMPGVEKYGDRMPAVRAQQGRSGVIAGDYQHVGVQFDYGWDDHLVRVFDHRDLAVEVAVLSGACLLYTSPSPRD